MRFCQKIGLKISQKKSKKGQNIREFGQNCTKFENISKKGSLMRATIARTKQLEYPLDVSGTELKVYDGALLGKLFLP